MEGIGRFPLKMPTKIQIHIFILIRIYHLFLNVVVSDRFLFSLFSSMMALLLGLVALGAAIYPGAAGTTRAPRLENITIYHVNPEVRPFALRTHTHQPRNFRSLFDFGEAGAFFFLLRQTSAHKECED